MSDVPTLRQHPPLVRPMVARSRTEPHRSSTPLELLFDLCFVVAVAAAARALHHEVVEDHLANGVLGYAMTFFAIWWAWMGFTWFASAYDTDDVPYRLLTLLQISGVLVLAAGVQSAVEDREFATVTLGYVVMRVALVAQWLRVAVQHEPGRSHALRYAVGTTIVQVGWLLRLLLPESLGVAGFLLLVVAELAVPLWAEHELDQPIPWHPGHIAERYGLFTIIVLGETILAAAVAMQAALDTGRDRGALLVVAAGGLVVIFGLWWTAFDRSPEEGLRTSPRGAFRWGYGFLVVFAALGAVGAGIEVVAETVHHEVELSERLAALTLAVPVAAYLVTMGALHTWINRHRHDRVVIPFSVAAVLVLLTGVAAPVLGLPVAVVVMAGVLAGLVTYDLMTRDPVPAAQEV